MRLLLCVLFLAACASSPAHRRGVEGECVSDRDCRYGLICRGESAGNGRRCQYETWGSCESQEDCLTGHICREGACTVACTSDPECPQGVCTMGECASEKRAECLTASDCASDERCALGRCERRSAAVCFTDLDCGTGEHCMGGSCR